MLLAVELGFELNVGNAAPPYGAYVLEFITHQKGLGNTVVTNLLHTVNLQTIGTVAPPSGTNPGIFISGVFHGVSKYDATFKLKAFPVKFQNATVLLRLTGPDGQITNLTNATARTK